MADTTLSSSVSVGKGERPRIGGGGGAPDSRLPGAGTARRVAPMVPKLLGACAGANVSRAGSCGPGDEGFARAGVEGALARADGVAGRVLVSGARGTSGGICTGAADGFEPRGSAFLSAGAGSDEASSATR